MALIRSGITACCNFLLRSPNIMQQNLQQVRNKYLDCRMRRDVKRRGMAKENATMRLRYLCLKRNNILPIELRNIAESEMQANVPRQAHPRQLTNRCVVTSRGRGVLCRWRLSRFIFRHLGDYNKMSGVQRALW